MITFNELCLTIKNNPYCIIINTHNKVLCEDFIDYIVVSGYYPIHNKKVLSIYIDNRYSRLTITIE